MFELLLICRLPEHRVMKEEPMPTSRHGVKVWADIIYQISPDKEKKKKDKGEEELRFELKSIPPQYILDVPGYEADIKDWQATEREG